MWRSRLVACCALLLALGCQDRQQLPLSADLWDADHDRADGAIGNPHFWLLPPIVKQPFIPDKFNRRLSPNVRITQQAPCPLKQIAYFTTTTGPGSTVVMDAANSNYSLVWQTKNFADVTAPCVYRLAVELSGDADHVGLVLGFGEVEMLTSASMKSLVTGEFIPLPEDRSFPFRFFIGPGAAFFTQTGDDACRPDRDCGEAVLDPTRDNVVLTDDQRAGIFVPDAALDDAGGEVVLVIEERTDRPCFAGVNLTQFDDCYRFEAIRVTARDGDDVGGGDFVIAQEEERNTSFTFGDGDAATLVDNYTIGICVEVGDLTPEEAELLQIYRFEPETGELQTLDDVSAPFLPCDPNFAPGGSLGSRNLFQRGWQLVRGGLRALFGPRVLYASSAVIDVGLGGSGDDLSYFTWGPPGRITKDSDDPQTAEAGTAVPSAPAVNVIDGDGVPIGNVRVRFEVTSGGGTIEIPQGPDTLSGPTFIVRTDADGIASVLNWRLGPGAGATNTLTASIVGGIGSPSTTFTAIGIPAGTLLVRPSRAGLTAVSPVILPLVQRSGLSMQDTTGIQLEVSPTTGASWSSSDPTGATASVNTTGLVAVVQGNDDSSTANEVVITATGTAGVGSIKINSFSFDHFPRFTTLVWRPVPGAATYEVLREFGNGCTTGTANCTTWSSHGSTTTTQLHLVFEFVGAQPGRWWVVARDATGVILDTSEIVYFRYII